MAKKNRPQKGSTEGGNGKSGEKANVTSDFPKFSLREAIQVPDALENKAGGQPLPPTELAIAVGKSPGSSVFRLMLYASNKYGLSVGSHVADRITVTELGSRIVLPQSLEDKQQAIIQAALFPATFRAIYENYKGKKLPENQFFQAALIREFKVPREHAEQCVSIFLDNVEFAGLVREASTGRWLTTTLTPVAPGEQAVAAEDGEQGEDREEPSKGNGRLATDTPAPQPTPPAPAAPADDPRSRRVFVTHGKNKSLVPQLKELLNFGGFEPVVSVERESVSKPVPDKVMDDMRSCGAAIIHVDAERELISAEGQKEIVLNANVLIEIGGALALYGRRFILLVQKGVRLPSNLQGLYEVRYEGDALDGEATLRLLKAFNDFKSYKPLQAVVAQ
jgi:predicted nucleotide-binding protein